MATVLDNEATRSVFWNHADTTAYVLSTEV